MDPLKNYAHSHACKYLVGSPPGYAFGDKMLF